MMTVHTEFPKFDNIDAFNKILGAVQPLGFEDTSWSNDVSPSIGIYDDADEYIFRLWVDFKDPAQREYDDLSVYVMTLGDEDIVAANDVDTFVQDVLTKLTEILAKCYVDELVDKLDPPERDAVREGRAVPNDFYDANESLIVAWDHTFGRSPFDADGHLNEATLNLFNAAMAIAHPQV
jgi:hypothetical protein